MKAQVNEDNTGALLPAIDILDGRVVRLYRGDYERVRRFSRSPEEHLEFLASAGVMRVHLVDLAGARDGTFTIAGVTRYARDLGLDVQAGGGVRADADVQRLAAAGVRHVVAGSIFAAKPAAVASWARGANVRLVAALDARCQGSVYRVFTHGWTRPGPELDEALRTAVQTGVDEVLLTDIDCDGTAAGPAVALYARAVTMLDQEFDGAQQISLQASGGVRDLADVSECLRAGATRVIVGTAWLDGTITIGGKTWSPDAS